MEVLAVARPPAKELTQRELEVMHVFWRLGKATAMQTRDDLAEQGRDLTYTTVATLVRNLTCGKKDVEVRAALGILGTEGRLRELVEHEERLAEVERQLREKKP